MLQLFGQVRNGTVRNLNIQQRVFNSFRHTYNEIRPHEALGDETPASRWTPSTRPYPERIAPPDYPRHVEVRRVSNAGTFLVTDGPNECDSKRSRSRSVAPC